MLPIIPHIKTDPSGIYVISNCFTLSEINQINQGLNNLPYSKAKLSTPKDSSHNSLRKSQLKWIYQTSDWYWLYQKQL